MIQWRKFLDERNRIVREKWRNQPSVEWQNGNNNNRKGKNFLWREDVVSLIQICVDWKKRWNSLNKKIRPCCAAERENCAYFVCPRWVHIQSSLCICADTHTWAAFLLLKTWAKAWLVFFSYVRVFCAVVVVSLFVLLINSIGEPKRNERFLLPHWKKKKSLGGY